MPGLPFLLWPLRNLARRFGVDIVPYLPVLKGVDEGIAQTIDAVRPYTMTSDQRVAALCDAVRYVVANRIAGDIVECGVWKGGSMMAVARTLLEMGDRTRDLHLFDTFEGMTEPTGEDVTLTGETAADLMAASTDREDAESVWCRAPLDVVQQAMASVGYDGSKVHYIKGRVEDTIPAAAPERIALLRLDTDWYESTRHEMIHLFPRLCVGGVLILDDYGHWLGARRAVDEYLREHNEPLFLQKIDYTGRHAVKWR
ncbi:MAG: TylF/MycF/NovP-related O-methyltransferase [Burkholderiales bacterium]